MSLSCRRPVLTYTFETSWSAITLEVTYDPKASADPNDADNPTDVNSDFCCVCGAGGSLTMCDFCANSFHYREGQPNCHPKASLAEVSEGMCKERKT